MGQPHARNQNQATQPCEDRGAQHLKAAPVEALLLLVDGPLGKGSVVMADIQHSVWVMLLSL